MAEQAAPPSTASSPSTPEDAAIAQARRRKERREAKIRAGASTRLNKISGLGGGLQREDPAPVKPAATEHADPDEVDISEHFYQPATTQRIPGGGGSDTDADAQRRQLQQMQQLFGAQSGVGGGAPGSNPFLDGGLFGPGGGGPGAGMDGSGVGAADDPMAAMLNQMMQSMGGMGGGGGPGGPGGAAFPPGGGPFPGFPGAAAGAAGATPASTTAANVWRVAHAIVALALGLYLVLATPFAGTRAEREQQQQSAAAAAAGSAFDADTAELHRRYFFYAFASAETVLLTTRYFLDGGLSGGGGSGGGTDNGGLVGMALGFLPPNVRRSLQLVQRYWQIFSTVRSDLLACVFVLGVCSWLRA